MWIASAMLGFPYGMGATSLPMVCLDWFGMGTSLLLLFFFVLNYLTTYENSTFRGKLGLHVRFAHRCVGRFFARVWADLGRSRESS